MPLQGFSVPLSPEGRASLTPVPPWHYAGDLLVVDFAVDPAAVKAVLPRGLEPDPHDPGGCVAFFVAWQYASESGEEYLDPARSQYNGSPCDSGVLPARERGRRRLRPTLARRMLGARHSP